MIIKVIFHTYKDNFPLMSEGRLPFNADTLHNLMTALILELSDLVTLPPLAYISRHTNDKIPPQRLAPFLTKFHNFVNTLGKDQPYNIPTVWFVGHFQDYGSITQVRRKLGQKNLKYFDDDEECKSFDQFNQAYWDEKSDAEPFVRFLHQATMIGVDLLKTADYKQKLNQLGRLECQQYSDKDEAKSDLKEMERYLRENSPYYKKHITAIASEYKQFWINFIKWKKTESILTSWPHFLFNICGISHPPEHPPLKIKPEEAFEGWW